jgi:hypothetical protein
VAEASPIDTILKVSGGFCVSRALHCVAEAGVADALGEEAIEIGTLARSTGLNPDALERLLRLLSAHAIFDAADGMVRHNEASSLLRSDHPQSARGLAEMFGLPAIWNSFAAMSHTLRTGRPAVEQVYPEGLWAYFAGHPSESEIFDRAMLGKSYAQVASVVAGYDFSGASVVGDIGGGRGHLLHAILAANPHLKGVLFDQPHVVAAATDIASDRLSLVGGDFFATELPVCDVYILMEVIHDWDDEESLAILSAVARAAPGGAVLLLVEQLLDESGGPHWSKMLDVHMLTLLTGRQRTHREYERLMEKAGFRPTRSIDTFSGASIVEAVKD